MVKFVEGRARMGRGVVGREIGRGGLGRAEFVGGGGDLLGHVLDCTLPFVAIATVFGNRFSRVERPKKWSPWPWMM